MASQAGFENNEELRDIHTGLGVAHNVAYPSSFLPLPFGLAPGAVTYGTNLGLKYVPPVLEAPATVNRFPTTPDECGYVLSHDRPSQQLYQDYLHILINFDNDFGELGRPTVEHWNTDAQVDLSYRGAPFDPNVYVLPSGANSFHWQATTLITPLLDYPPYFLLNGKVAKDSAKKTSTAAKNKAARRKALRILRKMFKNAKKEFKRQRKSWLNPDGIPTNGGSINNQKFQTFRVYDVFVPEISASQQVFDIEATEIGGEFLRNHIEDIRATISASDKCGKTPRVNYTAPSFLKTGEDIEISWKARDDNFHPSRAPYGEVTQILRIRDTKPPLILAPPNKVILSDQNQQVDVGSAAVFDLASQNISVFNNAPNTFATNQRREITWQAIDDSGNLATDTQWVTVKSQNTPPTAVAQTVSGMSHEEIDIVLTGIDTDTVMSNTGVNIVDPLNFTMEQRPENGFFVAPLLPYFIEDFRIERQLGQTTDSVNDYLSEQCRMGIEPARDVVTDPEYITVLDNGDMYVRDDYVVCLVNPGDLDRRNRIALFRDSELIAEADIPDDSRSLFIAPSGEVTFTNRQRGDDGRLIVYPANLDSSQQYSYRFDHAFTDGIKLQRTASAAFDANNIIYVTDGQVIYLFDGNNVSSSGQPAVLDLYSNSEGERRFLEQGSSSARPPDITFDSENNVYVSDPGNDRIWKFAEPTFQRNAQGHIINFTAGELVGWLGKCDFSLQNSGACDTENHHSFGFTCTNQTCGVVEANGENTPHCPEFQIRGECTGGDRPSQFDEPAGIAMSPKDVLYVTDYQNSRVQRFTVDGEFSGQALSPTPNGSSFVLGDFGRPQDIAVNSDKFYILDQEKDLLHVLDTSPFKDLTDSSATVTYKSENNHLGSDSFVFGVNDGLEQSEATVRVNLTRNFRRPEAAVDLEFEATEDQFVDLELEASDPDGNLDTLTYRITEQPEHGTLSGTGANRRYTPNANYFGEDTFAFVANDGREDSEPATVKLTVLPVNDSPIVNAESLFDAGLGHLTRFEADVIDPDGLDDHRMVIDWGDGTVEPEGEVKDDGTKDGPILTNGSEGVAGLSAEHVYTELGTKNLRICMSDLPSTQKLTSCNDPDVNAVHSVIVNVKPMIELGMIVEDSLPKEEDEEAGITRSVAATDGDTVTYFFEIHNVKPDIGPGIPATNTTLDVVLSEKMVLDDVRTTQGSCSNFQVVDEETQALETAIECNVQTITPTVEMNSSNLMLTKMVAEVVTVEVDVTFDGTLAEDSIEPIVAALSADQEDASESDISGRDTLVKVNPAFDADGDGVVNGEDAFPGDPSEQFDTDSDGIGNNADRDDDGDEMPDTWEEQNGFDSLDASDATQDRDNDGLLNVDEYRAGSNPDDTDSDKDRLADGADNCPADRNPNQEDEDNDAIGDACDQDFYKNFALLADSSGNNAPEIAGLQIDAELNIQVQISDASTGGFLRNLSFLNQDWNAKEVLSINEGLASPSVAVRAERVDDGTPIIQIKNSATGSLVKNVFPWSSNWKLVDTALVPDLAVGGPAIATLARRKNDGVMGVELRDPVDGARINIIYPLGATWTPHQLGVVPNVNGDPAIAVLATRNSDGLTVVQVRNARTGDLIRNVYPLGLNFTPEEMRIIPDVDGDGVWDTAVRMTRDSDGLELIQVRNTVTQDLIKNTYPIGAGGRGWTTQRFQALNQNGEDRIAILSTRDSDDAMLVQIKDPATGGLIQNNWLIGSPWALQQGYKVVTDFTGNNTDELAVLTNNKNNGSRLIQIRDGQTNALIRNVFQPN